MALRDYICCKICETKLVPDGYDDGREYLATKWPESSKDTTWVNVLTCPDCVAKLEAKIEWLEESVRLYVTTINMLSR